MAIRLTDSQRDLVAQHLSLVFRIARRVFRRNAGRMHLHDLEGHGLDGLVYAALRFDAARGACFATFADYRIRGAMLDAVRATTRENVVALPAATTLLPTMPPAADDLAIARQTMRRLSRAVGCLTPRERHFIDRVYREGRDITGAGAELGLSKSWASRLHARAIDQLRLAAG